MKITLDNYEAFFLDYIEGRLNSQELSELSLFLNLRPELKPELQFSENIIIQPSKHVYQNKNLIKKLDFEDASITTYNFDDFCIAYYERILSTKKTNELLNFCSLEPQRQKYFTEYEQILLLPQTKLKFRNKKALYKYQSRSIHIFRISSIAASISILIFVYLNYKSKNDTFSMMPSIASSKIIKQENVKKKHLMVSNKNLNINNLSIKKSVTLSPIKKISNGIKNTNVVASEPKLLGQIPLPELKLLTTTNQKHNLAQIKNIDLQPENKNTLATSNNLLKNIENKLVDINEFKNKKRNFSLLKIAQVGIRGINKLTDSNMTLTEKTDSIGNITALSFESDLLEYHRNKRN